MNKNDICKIGIGTWKIDPENFEKDLEALKYSFDLGQNYLPLSLLYNNGKVVEKMKDFIKLVGRENLFICANLERYVEKIEDVENQLNYYLKILDIDYVDCFQIHTFAVCKIPMLEIYREIDGLVKLGKVKYIGISNVNLEQLKQINSIVKIDFFEGIYNLDCKYYENKGLIDYCKENDILFTAYQPLRRNKIAQKNYEFLKQLAEKYNKTQNQVMINWIIKEKEIIPIIKSTNKDRIKENIEALDFEMNKEDYEILNEFQNEKINSIEINWNDESGVTIDQLANQNGGEI
ncbi:MAG: aldo/keto reductase [Clostridia bacterium]|nr:aldo/keto reductase [Clostridia bacterium]